MGSRNERTAYTDVKGRKNAAEPRCTGLAVLYVYGRDAGQILASLPGFERMCHRARAFFNLVQMSPNPFRFCVWDFKHSQRIQSIRPLHTVLPDELHVACKETHPRVGRVENQLKDIKNAAEVK